MASVASAMGGRHPVDPGKPLIDYLTALMLTPVLLLGTSIGTFRSSCLSCTCCRSTVNATLAFTLRHAGMEIYMAGDVSPVTVWCCRCAAERAVPQLAADVSADGAAAVADGPHRPQGRPPVQGVHRPKTSLSNHSSLRNTRTCGSHRQNYRSCLSCRESNVTAGRERGAQHSNSGNPRWHRDAAAPAAGRGATAAGRAPRVHGWQRGGRQPSWRQHWRRRQPTWFSSGSSETRPQAR